MKNPPNQTKTPTTQQKKRLEIEVKLLSENAYTPVKAKKGSIGYDLTIPEDVVIPAHSRIVVPLQLAINLPYGVEGKIEPRSGFSSKGMEGHGTRILKTRRFGIFPAKKFIFEQRRYNADVIPGKIDPLYTDSIGVIILNNDEQFTLRRGTRIAQISFYYAMNPRFIYVEELSCNSRGGGFGSSGSDAITKDKKSVAEVAADTLQHLDKAMAPPTKHG